MSYADRLYGAALVVDEKGNIVKDRYGFVEDMVTELEEARDTIAKLTLLKSLPGLEEAAEELNERQLEIKRLELRVMQGDDALKDARELEAFWRRAAEQALRMWAHNEDEVERLETRYTALLKHYGACER